MPREAPMMIRRMRNRNTPADGSQAENRRRHRSAPWSSRHRLSRSSMASFSTHGPGHSDRGCRGTAQQPECELAAIPPHVTQQSAARGHPLSIWLLFQRHGSTRWKSARALVPRDSALRSGPLGTTACRFGAEEYRPRRPAPHAGKCRSVSDPPAPAASTGQRDWLWRIVEFRQAPVLERLTARCCLLARNRGADNAHMRSRFLTTALCLSFLSCSAQALTPRVMSPR